MTPRIQVALQPEIQRRARQRANDLGVTLAEYIRRLVTRDLGASHKMVDSSVVFDLGDSGGSSIATDKDAMIAGAARKAK